jgi:hypothetical protein
VCASASTSQWLKPRLVWPRCCAASDFRWLPLLLPSSTHGSHFGQKSASNSTYMSEMTKCCTYSPSPMVQLNLERSGKNTLLQATWFSVPKRRKRVSGKLDTSSSFARQVRHRCRIQVRRIAVLHRTHSPCASRDAFSTTAQAQEPFRLYSMSSLQHFSCAFPNYNAGGHSVAGCYTRHNGTVCNPQVVDPIDLKFAVYD